MKEALEPIGLTDGVSSSSAQRLVDLRLVDLGLVDLATRLQLLYLFHQPSGVGG